VSNFLFEGAVGMSLFFILSGFVLCYRYQNYKFNPEELRYYTIHRLSRLYPIYVLSAITCLPWFGVCLEETSITAVLHFVLKVVFILFANIFLLQAWIPKLFDYWNNGGSWSISVEAFFYALFPLIQNKIRKLPIKILIFIGIVAYIFTIFFGISYVLFSDPSAIRIIYSVPIFRFPEFIIGVVAATISIKYPNQNKVNYNIILIGVFILIIIYLGFFGNPNSGYTVHNFIVIPCITLIIYCAANGKSGPITKLLSAKFLVILGHASYSFYSLQALIILSIISYHDQLIKIFPFLKKNFILTIAALIILICISLLSYFFIEEPIRRYLNKRYSKTL
jgi:peptidoglycan/LPS O-acetylase OafA/YrhL